MTHYVKSKHYAVDNAFFEGKSMKGCRHSPFLPGD